MIIETYVYVCDGCGVQASDRAHEKLSTAWQDAKREGWERHESVLDGTGHVGSSHYCRRCSLRRRQLARAATM